MPPAPASRKTRTERAATWLAKHGVLPTLPHDWTEKEVTLQQLVDLGMLTAAEAAREAGVVVGVVEAPDGDVDAAGDDGAAAAAAAAPAPDLSMKVLLYSQFPMAKDENTED